ncbi:uncharacterized protein LOC117169752 [Belonocnema kinseyi]|uniref:uncharacterized protein LOC117169752 n=1 Tax=Belonocnema kinseyi TaxID=2817044 RepID=UPI00143D8931|nr:uncharacterized protein LOC117169752 [Belonocnema kinseyi]
MVLPHFFVVDEIFPVNHYSMPPHPRRRPLARRERIFNHRLSRARNCIEDAFGILTGGWRILHTALSFKLNKSIAIVQALICLHNFILDDELPRKDVDRQYLRPLRYAHLNLRDVPLRARQEENVPAGNEEEIIPPHVIQHREMLTDYFVS